jgi:diguanylate cyclase (GGDEF)-like protein
LLLTSGSLEAPANDGRPVIGTPAIDWLGVPLRTGRRSIGALVVQSYSGAVRYSGHDKKLLQFVSTQVAAAIMRTQLFARLLHAAGHDPLTGLANRGLFEDRLNSALARVRRNHARFALLYIDLDKFKDVNDFHGHATGDLLLQEVARRLQACVRESDTVARMGGDEFVVLLNNVDLPQHATHVAVKIRDALSRPYLLGDQALFSLPSIGIALYPEHGGSMEALLQHADSAMYSSKKVTG